MLTKDQEDLKARLQRELLHVRKNVLNFRSGFPCSREVCLKVKDLENKLLSIDPQACLYRKLSNCFSDTCLGRRKDDLK